MSAIAQYRTVLRTLRSAEIPHGYRTWHGVITNLAVTVLGLVLTIYLFIQAPRI